MDLSLPSLQADDAPAPLKTSSKSDRRSSHAFRREVVTPKKGTKDSFGVSSGDPSTGARRTRAMSMMMELKERHENNSPNKRQMRHSMACTTAKTNMGDDDGRIMSLLQQYRQAQEERLRIESSREPTPASKLIGRDNTSRTVPEDANHGEQALAGTAVKAPSLERELTLEAELSATKLRLAQVQRRASVMPTPAGPITHKSRSNEVGTVADTDMSVSNAAEIEQTHNSPQAESSFPAFVDGGRTKSASLGGIPTTKPLLRAGASLAARYLLSADNLIRPCTRAACKC